ncbi:hypothetical protein [Lacihabitans soyangensis]|uniref:MG2 domain-containing protein n=1 Tax=Lacihabitans soyangensis TaxID=869394 RepID=A0AAE3H2Z5_9BACT|nr:hypothetical protein [Lacihabitans soyangensis]MCP9763049.1 hypothetical protein [Lacihabitans soyangensis]
MQKFKFLVLLVFCAIQISAQTSTYQSEKVFVHTDKDAYVAGDTIWLKTYVFDATSHHLSQKSQVLYLLFQNKQNEIINESKLAVQNGHANSQIILPKNLAAGQYELTAYTQLMRNYSEKAFYTKTFKVSGVLPGAASPLATKVVQKPEVVFYPEGGQLVDAISCKVAVKLNNFMNLPKGFEGKIEDSTGKLITTFYPDLQKIGTFIIKPETGMKYYAVFSLAGKMYKELLPASQQFGYVLSTDNVIYSDGLFINVFTNINVPEKFNIVVRQRGEIITTVPFETVSTNFKFVLNNDLVPNSGVVEIAVEDLTGKVVCKRLVYFLNNAKNSLQIDNYKPNLLPKGKVNFDLYVLDDNQRPMSNLDLSISVTDITPPTVFSQKIENMQNSLVFDADFEAEIQKLDSLFEFQPTVSKFYLDNLMMTMDWKKEAKTNVFKEEKSLAMKGTALQSMVPYENQKLSLFLWDKIGMKYQETQTDSSGNFVVYDHWTDSVKVLALNNEGQYLDLKLEGVYSPKVSITPPAVVAKTPANGVTAKPTAVNKPNTTPAVQTKAVALKEVVVTGKMSKDLKNDYRRRGYNWEADFETAVTVDSSSGITSVVDLIEKNVPELTGKLNGGNQNWVMVDGTRVPVGFLNLLKPVDIVWLDFLNKKEKTAKLGQEAGTIVNLLTAKGKDLLSIYKANNYQTFMGYQYARNIFAPKYTKATAKPDRRKTLYWNPLLKTDIYGKTNIGFYNADLTKKYLITVYGTDGKGKTISQRMILK